VNVIVGAQLLFAVQDKLPGAVGIIIIALLTFIITLFGYKVVHTYEKWSWIPVFIIFLILMGEFIHMGAYSPLPRGSGKEEAGSVLSFAAAVFGFATGWTSYAADYTVYQPATTSRKRVAIWTWLGLIIPLLFTELLGAAVITGINSTAHPEIAKGYESGGVGGLIGSILINKTGGFGRFCLVVLALSIIANNCPNIYSVSLTLQVLARVSQRVPRFVWTFLGTLAYIAIAIPGYSHFETILQNFMLLIGYWLAIYEGISLSEHIIYRRGMTGYNVEDYDQPSKLPPGIAAIIAFCFGIMGAVLGMSQVWFIGPIAKLCGAPPFGGDVGFMLAFAFSATAYNIMRPFEKKYFGR
jgi:NCS1 nucleoside transporter family